MDTLTNLLDILQKGWETWEEIEERKTNETKDKSSNLADNNDIVEGTEINKPEKEQDLIISRLEEGLISATAQVMDTVKKLNALEGSNTLLEKQIEEYKEREAEYKKRILSLETIINTKKKEQENYEITLKEIYGIRNEMLVELGKIYNMKEDLTDRCNILEVESQSIKRNFETTKKENTLLRKLLAIAEVVTEQKYSVKIFNHNKNEDECCHDCKNCIDMSRFINICEGNKKLRESYENAMMEVEQLKALLLFERKKKTNRLQHNILKSFKIWNENIERCRKAIERLNILLSGVDDISTDGNMDENCISFKTNFVGLCSAASETINMRKNLEKTIHKFLEIRSDDDFYTSFRYKVEASSMKDEEIEALRNKLRDRPQMKSKEVETDKIEEIFRTESDEIKEKEDIADDILVEKGEYRKEDEELQRLTITNKRSPPISTKTQEGKEKEAKIINKTIVSAEPKKDNCNNNSNTNNKINEELNPLAPAHQHGHNPQIQFIDPNQQPKTKTQTSISMHQDPRGRNARRRFIYDIDI